MSCKIENCKSLIYRSGYCCGHYKRLRRHGDATGGGRSHELHGMNKSIEYTSWCKMKSRCNNLNDTNYSYYGGRGIKVCDEWENSFVAFYTSLGKRPSIAYTLDRIDNNGNYEPNNCRWGTKSEQSFNTRKRSDNKSGYKGVIWDRTRNKWRAEIRYNNNRYNLGRFNNIVDAVKAYRDKRDELTT